MNELTIECPFCHQQIKLDSKILARHFGRNGGLTRRKVGKEELSKWGKLAAAKRWSKIKRD